MFRRDPEAIERTNSAQAVGRRGPAQAPANGSIAGQVPARVDSLRVDLSREDRLRVRLAICFALAVVTGAHAKQTVTPVPPPPPLQSTFPQFQTYAGCLMNCDSRQGTCQGTCSVTNSPTATFATTPMGTRPDPGALAACYQSRNTQALTCKQTCTPPH
jgi:hypothetical protein